MKFTLTPGAELELITPGEVRGIVNELITPWARGPQTERDFQTLKLDGSGNGQSSVFRVPVGLSFRLHRLLIDLDAGAGAYTPGAPFTSAGYAEILRGGVREDFYPFVQGLPALLTAGKDEALVYSNGETVDVNIVTGPVSGVLILRVQGTLQPLTTD